MEILFLFITYLFPLFFLSIILVLFCSFKFISILFLSSLVLMYAPLSLNVCNSRKLLTKKKKKYVQVTSGIMNYSICTHALKGVRLGLNVCL